VRAKGVTRAPLNFGLWSSHGPCKTDTSTRWGCAGSRQEGCSFFRRGSFERDRESGQFPGAVPTVRAASLSQPPMKTALAFARAA
jgi:hypothetical protein